ncbi:MAG: adenosylcobinamide-phosphate synthase CbiB [Clostridium sp.]|nr:adenosylcobinamide-phosphate synthase CbiB [Clostridium sp.]
MASIYMALIIDLILGDPHWFPHPVRLIGKYIGILEGLVKKLSLNSKLLKLSGIILTVSTVILTYSICLYLLKWAKFINIYFYYLLNVIILWTCIAPKCLKVEAMKIYDLLNKGEVIKARKQLSYIVGRDTKDLDESEIVRAVVETVSENTSDGVIAPLFYMFIGGAPLALTYKAINTLDSMVGYKKDFYYNFGWASARLDDIVNLVPARLTACFMVAASFVLGLDYKNCIKIIKRDRRNHKSPNSAYPEAATAGALGVQLGGSNSYFGEIVYKPTIGDSLKELSKDDIVKSIELMYLCTYVAVMVFSMIKIFLGRWIL